MTESGVSTFFLVGLIIFVLVIVGIVWILSASYRYIPDTKSLSLETSENRLVSYDTSHHLSIHDDSEVLEICRKILSRIYDYEDVDIMNYIVIGSNPHNNPNCDLWYLRDTLGIDAYISVAYNKRDYRELSSKNVPCELGIFKALIDTGMDLKLNEYFTDLLSKRHIELSKCLHAKNMIPDESYGSYAYFTKFPDHNINTYMISSKLYRVNLLCSELEFKTLIDRLNRQAWLYW